MSDRVLREPTEAEAPLLASLIRAAFAEYQGLFDPPSSAHLETADVIWQKLQAARAVLALVGDTPAGCVFYEVQPDHAYLFRLAVLPAYRRRGLGQALIEYVEARARERGLRCVRLGVRVALPRQRASYERLGYHLIEERRHPGYEQPTYVILEKELGE
jgi:ribosomal protein S18 acetylase RimI-like enzyme